MPSEHTNRHRAHVAQAQAMLRDTQLAPGLSAAAGGSFNAHNIDELLPDDDEIHMEGECSAKARLAASRACPSLAVPLETAAVMQYGDKSPVDISCKCSPCVCPLGSSPSGSLVPHRSCRLVRLSIAHGRSAAPCRPSMYLSVTGPPAPVPSRDDEALPPSALAELRALVDVAIGGKFDLTRSVVLDVARSQGSMPGQHMLATSSSGN